LPRRENINHHIFLAWLLYASMKLFAVVIIIVVILLVYVYANGNAENISDKGSEIADGERAEMFDEVAYDEAVRVENDRLLMDAREIAKSLAMQTQTTDQLDIIFSAALLLADDNIGFLGDFTDSTYETFYLADMVTEALGGQNLVFSVEGAPGTLADILFDDRDNMIISNQFGRDVEAQHTVGMFWEATTEKDRQRVKKTLNEQTTRSEMENAYMGYRYRRARAKIRLNMEYEALDEWIARTVYILDHLHRSTSTGIYDTLFVDDIDRRGNDFSITNFGGENITDRDAALIDTVVKAASEYYDSVDFETRRELLGAADNLITYENIKGVLGEDLKRQAAVIYHEFLVSGLADDRIKQIWADFNNYTISANIGADASNLSSNKVREYISGSIDYLVEITKYLKLTIYTILALNSALSSSVEGAEIKNMVTAVDNLIKHILMQDYDNNTINMIVSIKNVLTSETPRIVMEEINGEWVPIYSLSMMLYSLVPI